MGWGEEGVGWGEEGEASSFPLKLWVKSFINEIQPTFTLETPFLYKKGEPKLEPHSNLFFIIYSHYYKCFSVKDLFIFSVVLGWKGNEFQKFL